MKRDARSKYGAVPTVVDGVRFASRKEARRYSELKLMERAGEIVGLRLQPRLALDVNSERLGFYVGDFAYYADVRGPETIEDCKGVRTPIYRLKKKLIKAIYGVEILET